LSDIPIFTCIASTAAGMLRALAVSAAAVPV
jgi:hypothetical protein